MTTKNLNNFHESPLGFGHSRLATYYNREAFDFTLGKILGVTRKTNLKQAMLPYTRWNILEMRRLNVRQSDNNNCKPKTRAQRNWIGDEHTII